MTSPAVTFNALSDVGRQRAQNEDARGEIETAGGTLVIVCDGMGGHEAGEVASGIAVDAIGQIFKNSPSDDPAERLKAGFLVANQRILAHAEKGGIDSMGTTAVAAFVRDGKAWIAHVGDSRCYHLRGGAVVWRTADHTRIQKMLERGIITAEQAKTHEDANVVTRALGFTKGEDAPEPDIDSARDLRAGDVLLLCSDGLYDLVKDDEIAELGSEGVLEDATRELVELANRRGGHDNITVTIIRSGAPPAKRTGPRKTDLDEGVPDTAQKTAQLAKSPVTAADVERERAVAKAALEAAQRSRRALLLVVAGFALVAIAGAVFFLTRGGSQPARATAKLDGGGAPPPATDGGAATTAAVLDDAMPTDDGGTLVAPTWNSANPDRPKAHRDGGVGAAPSDGGAGGPAGAAGDAGVAASTGAANTTTGGTTKSAGTGSGATPTPSTGTGSGAATPKAGTGSPTTPASSGSTTTPKTGTGAAAGSGATTTPKPGTGAAAGSGATTTPKTATGATAGSGATTTPKTATGATAGAAATTTPKAGTGATAGSATKPPAGSGSAAKQAGGGT